MSWWWLAYPLLGCFAGFIAGLFGVGGGLTIVPLLFMLFAAQGFPIEHVMHLSLGTSMATIVVTSISSMRAHHAHGAVRWDIVRRIAPGLVARARWAARSSPAWVPTRPLAFAFTAIVYYASVQMVLDFKPKPARPAAHGLAGRRRHGDRAVSSLVAAGGGFLSIPYMVFCTT
jgi:uncharacterized membrane protein YfcA